jgi:hypothetical protein
MAARLVLAAALVALVATVAQPGAARTVQRCSPSSLRVRVVSDQRRYPVGGRVRLTVRVRNGGPRACPLPTGSCEPQVVVTDRADSVVWDRAQTQVVCTVRVGGTLPAGRTAVRTVVWDGTRCGGRDPQRCPGTPVAPGGYTATATWGGGAAGRVRFAIGS